MLHLLTFWPLCETSFCIRWTHLKSTGLARKYLVSLEMKSLMKKLSDSFLLTMPVESNRKLPVSKIYNRLYHLEPWFWRTKNKYLFYYFSLEWSIVAFMFSSVHRISWVFSKFLGTSECSSGWLSMYDEHEHKLNWKVCLLFATEGAKLSTLGKQIWFNQVYSSEALS